MSKSHGPIERIKCDHIESREPGEYGFHIGDHRIVEVCSVCANNMKVILLRTFVTEVLEEVFPKSLNIGGRR